ncbi:MAG: hypothetical protein ACOYUZ_04700 [Patescibacteria group bacterium]
MSKPAKVQVDLSASYLAMIKNSVGSKAYRNFYGAVDGKCRDLVQGGNLSCAFFVSGILNFFDLINDPHLTVAGLIKDLEKSGWKKVRKPKEGDVLIWEPVDFTGDGVKHAHVGFYLGNEKAVSNSWKSGTPIKHHCTFGVKAGKPKRRITAMYRHHF